jgi:hypothetical protein
MGRTFLQQQGSAKTASWLPGAAWAVEVAIFPSVAWLFRWDRADRWQSEKPTHNVSNIDVNETFAWHIVTVFLWLWNVVVMKV